MQVFVVLPTGKQVTIDVDTNATVKDLKGKIEAAEGSQENYTLVYGGLALSEDERTLTEAGIGNDATLQYAVPTEGGYSLIHFGIHIHCTVF